MTFSIRELLVLGFVVALSLLTFRSFVDTNQQPARLTRLQMEVKTMEAELSNSPPSSQIEDELAPLHTSSERAAAHFPVLRKKYSTIQPRGSGVLSVRSIPNLWVNRIRYRIIVPEGRSIWLKFGVHMVSTSTSSSRETDREDDLLTSSPGKTVIVFFSDHGIMEGDHGLMHKETLCREVLNACLIIADPNGKKNARISRPVELLDLAGTAMEMSGAPATSRAKAYGESLIPLLRGNIAG